MASTKRINEAPVEVVNNVPLPEPTIDYNFVRPSHYVQEDGRETWEHMLDIWTKEEVALWCEMTAYKYKDRMGRKPGESVEREQGKIDWYENKAKELRDKPTEKNKFLFWK